MQSDALLLRPTTALALGLVLAFHSLGGAQPTFQSAQPIWPEGREQEKNLFVGFRATFAAPEGERVWLKATASSLYIREYVNPAVSQAHFAASDERLNRLFAAGRETFSQNAVDIFMDCPSRERAGWLCDSFFTARVAYDLCGDTRVEKNFLENYLRPKRFEHLPEGMLQVTRNRTEVCQYFAIFFGIATPETHPKLWRTLAKDFGPQRKQTKAFPDVHPANAFIGNVLRLELLSRYGLAQQNLDESIAYLLYMADQTGTLWENDGAYASCDHGFASHVVHVLYRDVLGLNQVDGVNHAIKLRFADLRLDWCEGSVSSPAGRVELRWWQDGARTRYRVNVPAGYSVQVENRSDREWVRQP